MLASSGLRGTIVECLRGIFGLGGGIVCSVEAHKGKSEALSHEGENHDRGDLVSKID